MSKSTKRNMMSLQAILMIVLGFVLIFFILTATILYTVYDRSLVDFIQGIGREKPQVVVDEPDPVNPALLLETNADKGYTDSLWMLSDAYTEEMKMLDISLRDRCFSTSFVSTTNYMEVVFTGNGDESYTLTEFLTATTPKYLLLNFSGTGLTMDNDAVKLLYQAVLDVIWQHSPESTVILSGPLPVCGDNALHTAKVLQLDETLCKLAQSNNEKGKNAYYLPSPTTFFEGDKTLKKEYISEKNTVNALGCEVYFNYVLRHPVPDQQ